MLFIQVQRTWTSGLTRDTRNALVIVLTTVPLVIKYLLCHKSAAFVLTGKFQQDPLEEHFAAQRQKSGCSYNPNALQFLQTEKKFHLLKGITTSKSCNTYRAGKHKQSMIWNNSPLQKRKKVSCYKMILCLI